MFCLRFLELFHAVGWLALWPNTVPWGRVCFLLRFFYFYITTCSHVNEFHRFEIRVFLALQDNQSSLQLLSKERPRADLAVAFVFWPCVTFVTTWGVMSILLCVSTVMVWRYEYGIHPSSRDTLLGSKRYQAHLKIYNTIELCLSDFFLLKFCDKENHI